MDEVQKPSNSEHDMNIHRPENSNLKMQPTYKKTKNNRGRFLMITGLFKDDHRRNCLCK
jgi:hypothetical protein